MKQNAVLVVVFLVAAGAAVLAMHSAQRPPRQSLDERASFVRTHRAALDALRACVATSGGWTLTATTSVIDGGAPPAAARETDCRERLAALEAMRVESFADGSVLIVTSETGRPGNGVINSVAWLRQPGLFVSSLRSASLTLVDDDWYLVTEPR